MLRALNLPEYDPLINDMFNDFDETVFNNICLEQPWLSDTFDQLPDANVPNDDLLTDAVSEILKCKAELPSSDFPHSGDDFSDVVVGDEVEINATLIASPSNQTDTKEHGVHGTGYASGTISSTYLSPCDSTSSQIASPVSVDLSQPNNIPNCSAQISLEYPIQRKNVLQTSLFKRAEETVEPPILTSKRTFNKREFAPGNRVHLILHHNPSTIKFHNKVIHGNSPDIERGKTGTFYFNKKLSQQSEVLYSCSDGKHSTESPMFSGSHSSSESDIKDQSDDDQMTDVSYSKCEDMLSQEYIPQPRSSANFARSVSSFKRTASPLSKFSNLRYGNDDEPGFAYAQTARIMPQNLFRSQLSSSRIRSPVRLDRSEPGLLMLTSEEKRTLIAEGYTIPTRLPLTKQEERNLKKVRRKIKNKISAQESRRKKKEYLEALERKVSVYSQENVELRRRVDGLENTNRSLLGQLRLLQQLVSKSKSGGVTSSPAASVKSSTTVSSSSVGGHKSSAMQHQSQQQGNPGASFVSASAAAGVGTGDSEGGPSSTCLMVFALCFVALLVGQPMQPVSQSTTGTALSSVTSQIFTSSFLGSTPKIGYSWSPSGHRSTGGPAPSHLFQSTWLARHYFHWMDPGLDQPGELWQHDHLPAEMCAAVEVGPTGGGQQVDRTMPMREPGDSGAAGGLSQPVVMEPRSRLLGSPSELAECSAPPKRTFWSYLFGGSDSPSSGGSALGGICTQLEYVGTGLDGIGKHWLSDPATVLNRSRISLLPRFDAINHQVVANLSDAFFSARMALVSA